MKDYVVGIGWDVGGWCGQKQATAVARWTFGSNTVEWLGVSQPFGFSPNSQPGLSELILPAIRHVESDVVSDAPRITIAIDAPLSFPNSYLRLLASESIELTVPAQEIDNRLAYRDCERWLAEKYKKKPLSGPFDKLGNNSTLAMVTVNKLRNNGFVCVPQDLIKSNRVVIEAYPGITKTGPKKIEPAIPAVARHIPKKVPVGTDQYDAAICAVTALLYAGAAEALGLPDLEPIPEGMNLDEGWVYGLPADYVARQRR